jgi:predicted O-linked N-acetylglucosamine transferase (SPINDLY family)
MKAAAGSWLSRLFGRRDAPAAVPPTGAPLPAQLDAWMREGYAYHRDGKLQEAERLYRQILDAAPRYADAAYFLAMIVAGQGRREEALALYRAAAEAKPDEPTFLLALGIAQLHARRFDEAAQSLERALKFRPDDVEGRTYYAISLLELWLWDEAQAVLEPLARENPQLFEPCANLGSLYRQMRRIPESIEQYRKAIALQPNHLGAQNSLLFTLNYSDRHDAATIAEEHRAFGRRHARPGPPAPTDRRWPRRLRIGYLSPDFRRHVVMTFLEPVLERHDREKFEVFCFHTFPVKDAVTERVRAKVDIWSDCGAFSDAELADRIRADRIDILIDLAGHTSGHRIGVLAVKPAPLQVTYLGYPNTTGLPTVDYRITDALVDPPGRSDKLNVERLLRLPRPFLCYRAEPQAPPPGPAPARDRGQVTFGCFNNTVKLSDSFLDTAARVLNAVPGSRLVLKAGALNIPSVGDPVRQRFDLAGIAPERVELRGWATQVEHHMSAYREIDVALDSFPYNGTTTTFEALWMGVPVVTLRGDCHAGRVGACLLGWLGLHELIAGDTAEFVRICARLAGDLEGTGALRAGLRERLRASPLMDEEGLTRELERAYRAIWVEHLQLDPDARQ